MNSSHLTQEDLTAWIAGELRDSSDAFVRSHLEECPDCAQRVNEWQRLSSALKSIPDPALKPGTVGRIALRAREHREALVEKRQQRWLLVLLACYSAAFFLISWILMGAGMRFLRQKFGWGLEADALLFFVSTGAVSWLCLLGLLPILFRSKTQWKENSL